MLIVGLGGGTLPTALSQLYPKASIDVVELDPAVVASRSAISIQADRSNMHVFEQDARVWAKRAAAARERYDLIMLDAFNGDYIPEHLMTREYLPETRELLTERRRSGVEYVRDQPPLSQRIGHLCRRVRDILQSADRPTRANRVIIARRGRAARHSQALALAAKALVTPLRPYGVPIEDYPATTGHKTRLGYDTRAS